MEDTKETRPSTHSMIDIHMNSPRLGQRAHGLHTSEPDGVLELREADKYAIPNPEASCN